MHRNTLFVGFFCAFGIGIAAAVFGEQYAWHVWVALVLCSMFILAGVPRFRMALFLTSLVCGSFLGVWRGIIAQKWAQAERIYAGTEVVLDGIVLTDPREGIFDQRVIVGVRVCASESGESCSVEKILVRAPLYGLNLSMRQGVHATCTLEDIDNFTPDFDYRMYLATKGVRYTCTTQEIEEWESPLLRDAFYSALARARHYCEGVIAKSVQQPQAALAAGLLFGGDERLSQEWQNRFALTGLTHIVAVSGYNVSVIAHALILIGIMVGLWRRQAVWMAIGGIVLFVLMIGAPTPAIRAAVMGVTVLLLMIAGRIGSALPALFFAGAVMLAFNPLLVRYDIGFQLSFFATLGIIVMYPIVQRLRHGNTDQGLDLLDVVFVTVSAQIFVVPIIAYHFHTFATLSLIANIAVLPIIPFVMAITCAMLLGSLLSVSLALWLGWIVTIVLAWIFTVVQFFAEIPYTQIAFGDVSQLLVVLWYGVVGGILLLAHWKQKRHCTHRKK